MTKSLANRLYIKKRMFTLKMVEGTSLEEHIDEFNKVCDTLETIDAALNDEGKALLLISSLPKSYENLVDALMYGRQTLTLDECHKEGHFKRDCPEKKNKPKDSRNHSGDAAVVKEGGYESAGVCVATENNQKGKSSRGSFKRSSQKSNERLDYAHSDLWGPTQCVFEKFKEWKQLVENQTEKRLKNLKTDNGLEFCNQPFDNFCANEGKPTNYGILKAFGCPAYVHVSQGKLAHIALKGVFIGYLEGVKGFKVWCTDLNPPKCIVSKDVVFNEGSLMKMSHAPEVETNNSRSADKLEFEVEPSVFRNTTEAADSGINGSKPRRFKARLVAKGYTQQEGIDFKEVFSPVVKHASIRVILAITAMQDIELDQLDVKTTFLHGRLEEEIPISQPEGYDCCVYYKTIKDNLYIYLLLYVDDMLVAYKDMEEIDKLKMLLNSEFKMKDLGYARKILGMEIRMNRSKGTMFLSQEKYLKKVVKWILKYLNGTVNCGLMYGKTKANGEGLKGYIDSDYVGDLDRKRSLIEYTPATEAVKEALWLKGLVTELGLIQKSVSVYCDSSSVIHLSKNHAHHEKTKHIDVKLHFIRNEVSRGALKLVKIHTDENLADAFTKVIIVVKFRACLDLAGLCSVTISIVDSIKLILRLLPWMMRVFLQALDYEIWEIVCNGSFIPRKNALNKNEFHRVSNCSNAYEIWRKLEVVYEKTTNEEESHEVSNLALMAIGDESDDELDEVPQSRNDGEFLDESL
ncbi:reverse transcriptase Ty1/copia-type domain-containing protein [Citrus sinensis]|uniref:Reverse transcriptase Ty1/copia-type domain-containing protein n=1 Tax=Citrus sinensis TaxID=2711 RepID=A0ACB8IKY1_CITSI|nr:reverse transcriptase Ty1/copia-type domain-containing protein [Citrus sinensis]